MPNGGVSSVAFSNRQVLNRLGLQSATTNVMMVTKGTNRSTPGGNTPGPDWNTPGPDWTMTWERAQRVPQGDRLGKKAVWETIQRVCHRPGGALDITDGTTLRWWLWICNLGHHSRDVIGPGVTGARVSMTEDWMEATFTFYRTDGSRSRISLVRGRHTLDLYVL